YAIKELNEHLKLSTGTSLPVVNDIEDILRPAIHIGKTKLTVQLGLSPEILPPDTWVVRRVGNALIISGGDNNKDVDPVGKDLLPFGTLFATYEFLERVIGVRWFWPGDDGRMVPEHKDIILNNISWQGSPSYDTRFAFSAIPDGISSEVAWTWWRRMRWGGIGGNPIGMHSFTGWNAKYGKQHPEWFALQINGERLNGVDPENKKNGHLCYTNPEVIDTVIKEAREFFDKNSDRKFFTVMPGDSNEVYYCQCKNCQELVNPDAPKGKTHSYAIWSFVNKVASEIRKTHPDRYITCCAYAGYRLPPDNLYFEPNVIVTLCVADELRNPWKTDSKAKYVSELENWKRIVPNIYVWDYWLYRWHPGVYGTPAIFPHLLQDIYLLERTRVRGHVIELCNKDISGVLHNTWQDWMMDQINVYIGFKLLWDVNADVNALVKEYYKFFGPAESLMQKFYESMESAFLDPATKGKDLTWNWETCWQKTYTAEFVKQVMGYLREAERITRGIEPYHTRVEKVLKGFLTFEQASKRYSGVSTSGIEKDKNINVPKISVEPEIDGKLEEIVWNKALVLDDFVDLYNASSITKTEILIFHNGKNFYIGIRAHMEKQDIKKFAKPKTVDGAIWDYESCEIFFAPDTSSYYQFIIGPEDVFTDIYTPDIKKFSMENLKWNAEGIKYATSVQKGFWTAELKIPFSAIKYAPDSGWKVNFCRNYYYPKILESGDKKWAYEASSFFPVFGSFNNVAEFGFLRISE
ncbi:MAG: DUF4838 domain-containing protein, partial [Candidatus Omnitrophica bacterium]|nr:DUF4838 domain-containing protein [Candidatus Omnitrophota bacterium]